MKNKKLGLIVVLFVFVIVIFLFLFIKTDFLNNLGEKSGLSSNQQVKHLLAQRFNKSVEETEFTIEKENENYLVGQTSFGEGGIRVMAAKVDGVWMLVDTGNAFADCDKLREYSFPTEFLPSYCDCNDKFYNEPYSERIRPKYCD